MGLFGLFGKKKYVKNVERNNEFLKNCATKCNRLLLYVENNEKVEKEIRLLQDDFSHTTATDDTHAKKIEKQLTADFAELCAAIEQPGWNESDVIAMIRGLRGTILEIASMR